MKINGIEVGGFKYSAPESQFTVEHVNRMLKHYAHAIEKRPYFCDSSPLDMDAIYKMYIPIRLDRARKTLKYSTENGCVTWEDLLDCELWEVLEALTSGDKAHAVEELYDMIAVCLRTIDVLEGRQELGKPETKGEINA